MDTCYRRCEGLVEWGGSLFNQTKHYNQYNISDYCHYLREGRNELKIEVQENKKMNFDFGLRAY